MTTAATWRTEPSRSAACVPLAWCPTKRILSLAVNNPVQQSRGRHRIPLIGATDLKGVLEKLEFLSNQLGLDFSFACLRTYVDALQNCCSSPAQTRGQKRIKTCLHHLLPPEESLFTLDEGWPMECIGMKEHPEQRFVLRAVVEVKDDFGQHLSHRLLSSLPEVRSQTWFFVGARSWELWLRCCETFIDMESGKLIKK